MTVIAVSKDPEALTLTVTAEYDASPARVWELWADPRQLERWWGPPTHPATVTVHDLVPGGQVAYYMTGPGGEHYPGWWRITSTDAPRALEFTDGFSDATGAPDPAMPVTTTIVSLHPRDGGGTRMVVLSRFASVKAMEQLLAMGMEEGMIGALGQTDAILATPRA
jgi:uncharacterized protein YndB with AHSA1/START domain